MGHDVFSSKMRFAIVFGMMVFVLGIAFSLAFGSWIIGVVLALALASQIGTLAR